MKDFKITIIALLLLALTNATAQNANIDTNRNYRIWNAYTDYGLTFAIRSFIGGGISFNYTAGNTLRATRSEGYPVEAWHFTSTGNGYYIITNANITSLPRLSIDGRGSESEGSQIINNPSNITDNQQWKLTSVGGGNYRITNKATGLAITRDGAFDSGLISQRRYVGSNQQKWFLRDAGDGTGFDPEIEDEPQDLEFDLVSLFPNPAPFGGVINARVKTDKSGSIRFFIRNVRFFRYYNTFSIDVNKGETIIPIPLENLPSEVIPPGHLARGIYTITAFFGSSRADQKFIID